MGGLYVLLIICVLFLGYMIQHNFSKQDYIAKCVLEEKARVNATDICEAKYVLRDLDK